MKKGTKNIIRIVCVSLSAVAFANFSLLSNKTAAATMNWYYYYTGTNSGSHTGDTRYLAAAYSYISEINSIVKNNPNQTPHVTWKIGNKTKDMYLVDTEYVLPNDNPGNSTLGVYNFYYSTSLGSCSANGETRGAY